MIRADRESLPGPFLRSRQPCSCLQLNRVDDFGESRPISSHKLLGISSSFGQRHKQCFSHAILQFQQDFVVLPPF